MAPRPGASKAAGAGRGLPLLLALALLAPVAHAYPSLFVNEFANSKDSCLAHPTKGYAGHGAPSPDA